MLTPQIQLLKRCKGIRNLNKLHMPSIQPNQLKYLASTCNSLNQKEVWVEGM